MEAAYRLLQLLRLRVVRQVHALPGGRELGPADVEAHSRRRGIARRHRDPAPGRGLDPGRPLPVRPRRLCGLVLRRRCATSSPSSRPPSVAGHDPPQQRSWQVPDAPSQDVTLTIDGRSVTVPRGTLVVEAAKHLGIEIPVFCYHHKMDPVGACRMCVVEITPGPPRAQTACTSPVAPGMNVLTNSAMAVAARADVLEMELANHPLDCPVCDKGGECPLQDYTFRHAYPVSQIDAPRLHFQKPIPLSERIALDRERCVLCYRCTRYYDEVTWEQELTVRRAGRPLLHHQPVRPASAVVCQREHHRPLPRRRSHLARVALRVPPLGHGPHGVGVHQVLGRLQRDDVAAARGAGPDHLASERRHRRRLDLRSRTVRVHGRQPQGPSAGSDRQGQGDDLGGGAGGRGRRTPWQARRHLPAPRDHQRGAVSGQTAAGGPPAWRPGDARGTYPAPRARRPHASHPGSGRCEDASWSSPATPSASCRS